MAENAATTMTSKILAIAVTIIIITTVAIPIIEDMQDDQKTALNNTSYILAARAASDVTISIVNDNGTMTVGGYDASNAPVLFYSDTLILQKVSTTIRVFVYSGESVLNNAVITSCDIVSGQYSFTYNNTEYTGSITGTCLYPAEKGSYGLYQPSGQSPLYVDEDATIYAAVCNRAYSTLTGVSQIVQGTIKDGLDTDFAATFSNSAWVDLDNPKATANASQEEKGYYSLVGINYSVESSGTEYTNVVSTIVFAPISYHYVSDEDQSMINLIGIIPILLILVPVMIAVRMMTLRRN